MAIYKKQNSGYLPFVQKTEVTSPFTDIQNRAKIDDSLKTSFGVERLHVNSLELKSKEFGLNGEPVYGPDSGDDRIRFVGNWSSQFTPVGLFPITTTQGDYVEVTAYCTGLNMLIYESPTARQYDFYVDGVLDQAGVLINNSDVLNSRNYKTNIIKNVKSGLSLGWHTFRIELSSANDFLLYGFEIINESVDMTVKSGKAHGNGNEYIVENDLSVSYNTGFDNVADIDVGPKGGRVAVYVDPKDGLVKKRLTNVDAVAQYLSNTDHSNEAIYRKINFREFGRNRADDFSTLAGTASNRAFTLDDGTTTLVGNLVQYDSDAGKTEGLRPESVGSFIVLTFVGTGLDLTIDTNAGTTYEYFVDGISIGQEVTVLTSGKINKKICSGLPYGTHTIKWATVGTPSGGTSFIDAIIYQPKKPALPEGAIEVADYNLMADFVANATAGADTKSVGVLGKAAVREFVYTGTWAAPVVAPLRPYGLDLRTNATNSAVEYTFFGTGFDFRFTSAAGINLTMEIDGSSDLSGFTTSSYSAGSLTFSAATGNITGESLQGGVVVSGLPLGIHNVKVTTNNTVSFLVGGFDIITPIHSPHTTFGSLSMKDVRNFDSAKDVNKIVKEVDIFTIFSSVDDTVQKSQGISQILNRSDDEHLVYFEESFLDKKFKYFSGLQHTGGSTSNKTVGLIFDGLTTKSSARFVIEGNADQSGASTPPSEYININFKGKLQKDEFKD